LTHAVGVAVAHYKTPIRQLKQIAAEVANQAKDACLRDRNSATFEIFESLAPPDTGIEAARRRIFQRADAELARWLAIPGAEFTEFERCLRVLKSGGDDGFPRSQLYDALRSIRRKGGSLTDEAGEQAACGHLAAYRTRAGGAGKAALLEAHLPPDWQPHDRWAARPLPMALYLISQFWDYVDPFGTPLPAFPGVELGSS
jgi:hypothetical protein